MTPFTRIAPLMREFGINYTVNSEVPLDSESPAFHAHRAAHARVRHRLHHQQRGGPELWINVSLEIWKPRRRSSASRRSCAISTSATKHPAQL